MSAALPPTSKVEVAYETIRAGIESGDLKPGQEVPEAFLVDYVGLSRTPVRHALERLSGEGLVLTPPRATPTVSRLSIKGTRDLFEYRRMLEPVAAGIVAVRARDDLAVAEEFASFRLAFETFRDAGAQTDASDVQEHAEGFDRAIINRIDNTYLTRQLQELRSHTKRLRGIAHRTPGRSAEMLGDHVAVASLIEAGDEQGAADAMRTHLLHVEKSIFQSLLQLDHVEM